MTHSSDLQVRSGNRVERTLLKPNKNSSQLRLRQEHRQSHLLRPWTVVM
jgi:hypothetical protein